VLAAVLSFFLLSLIGIPFTGGFFGKFYVFSAALHAGNVWLAVIGLLNSGIACFYYLRLLAALYTRPHHERAVPWIPVTIPAAIALTFTAVATLLLGIAPNRILSLARRSANVTVHDSCADHPETCKAETTYSIR
jgi:NADH-quinone oxidoreductase subunit N